MPSLAHKLEWDITHKEYLLWQFSAVSFDRTLSTLEELRQRLCVYCAPGQVPATCDCKYAREIRDAMDALELAPLVRAMLIEHDSLKVRLRAAEAVCEAVEEADDERPLMVGISTVGTQTITDRLAAWKATKRGKN